MRCDQHLLTNRQSDTLKVSFASDLVDWSGQSDLRDSHCFYSANCDTYTASRPSEIEIEFR